jgi:hypothetical protein
MLIGYRSYYWIKVFQYQSKLTIMELTRDNYFEFKERDGVPVLSSSFIKNGIPMNGGNVVRMRAAFNKDSVSSDSKAKSFGSLLHLYAEDADNIVLMPEWTISATIKMILDVTFKLIRDTRDEFPSNDMNAHQSELMTVADQVEWRTKNKTEARMKFLLEGKEYWEFMNSTYDKVCLPGVDGQKVKDCVQGIREAGIETPLVKDDPTKETLRELPVYFVMNGKYPCKILIDLLEIDDVKKEAVVTDLKTTSSKVEHFISRYTYVPNWSTGIPEAIVSQGEYVKYKYFIQEYFYKIGLSHYLKDIGKEDYTIKFRFGVVETISPFYAKIVEVPVVWNSIASREFNEAMGIIDMWFAEDKLLDF